MIYSDTDIKKAIQSGRIIIEPYSEIDVQPASVDLHLHNQFMTLDTPTIRSGKRYTLTPNSFVLACTYEKVGLPDDVVARLEGISSLARRGLVLHLAGYIDPGWLGRITLELSNVSNKSIVLEDRMRIGQISFIKLTSPAEKPYSGKYQGSMGPVAGVSDEA